MNYAIILFQIPVRNAPKVAVTINVMPSISTLHAVFALVKISKINIGCAVKYKISDAFIFNVQLVVFFCLEPISVIGEHYTN